MRTNSRRSSRLHNALWGCTAQQAHADGSSWPCPRSCQTWEGSWGTPVHCWEWVSGYWEERQVMSGRANVQHPCYQCGESGEVLWCDDPITMDSVMDHICAQRWSINTCSYWIYVWSNCVTSSGLMPLSQCAILCQEWVTPVQSCRALQPQGGQGVLRMAKARAACLYVPHLLWVLRWAQAWSTGKNSSSIFGTSPPQYLYSHGSLCLEYLHWNYV